MSDLLRPPSRLPQDQPGRDLACSRCADLVRVLELPHEFIDPQLFVCEQCLQPAAGQLEIAQGPRRETRRYDPAIARIPYAPAFTRPEPEL